MWAGGETQESFCPPAETQRLPKSAPQPSAVVVSGLWKLPTNAGPQPGSTRWIPPPRPGPGGPVLRVGLGSGGPCGIRDQRALPPSAVQCRFTGLPHLAPSVGSARFPPPPALAHRSPDVVWQTPAPFPCNGYTSPRFGAGATPVGRCSRNRVCWGTATSELRPDPHEFFANSLGLGRTPAIHTAAIHRVVFDRRKLQHNVQNRSRSMSLSPRVCGGKSGPGAILKSKNC